MSGRSRHHGPPTTSAVEDPPTVNDKAKRANMLTKAFPFLLPRYIERDLPAKLRDLAGDLESLRSDGTPADAKLASAPLLVDWRCVLTPVGLRLAGFVAGHPLLGNRAAMTSQVWCERPASLLTGSSPEMK